MLQPGDPAPAFALACEDGAVIDSATLAGRPYVLYFYPKDSTPGCTQEACDLRDRMDRISAAGVAVFGVSRDSVRSHARFHAKQGLNFHLLSDPERALHLAYGCWGKKVMYGKEVEGTIRSTFLIGADGRVAAAWPKVSVAGHAEAVLAAVLSAAR
jgi:peroxiredoxin Q/BCP